MTFDTPGGREDKSYGRDDRLPMIYHNAIPDRKKSATTRNTKHMTATKMPMNCHGNQVSTATHNTIVDNLGDLSDINLALMKDNVNKMRRRRILRLVEAVFIKRFSAIHDMTSLLKHQFDKVAKENAKTFKILEMVRKQMSEFQLNTDYDSDDGAVAFELHADDVHVDDISRLKLPKLESVKADNDDEENRPSSLPQVFRLQSSDTEMFSQSKTNNIKRVAYKKSKGRIDDEQSANRTEKIGPSKLPIMVDNKRHVDRIQQRFDRRQHSAPSDVNAQSNKTKTGSETNKKAGKHPAVRIPSNLIRTESEVDKTALKPSQCKQAKSRYNDRKDAKPIDRNKSNALSKLVIQSKTTQYESDSSDDESLEQDDRFSMRKSYKKKDVSNPAKSYVPLNTSRRQEIERQIKKREGCILQPGRKNKTTRADGSD